MTLLMILTVNAITVYDCTSTKLRYGYLDLTEPEECADPEKDYTAPINVSIQILQTDLTQAVTGYQCKILLSDRVGHCGFDSILYGVTWLSWGEMVEVTAEMCREAVKEERITVEGHLINVPLGGKKTSKLALQGRIYKDAHCENGDPFTVKGTPYLDHFREVFIETHITKIRGEVHPQTGRVFWSNGINANYADLTVSDSTEGTLVWTKEKIDCLRDTSELYRGEASLYDLIKGDRNHGAVYVVNQTRTSQFGGFVTRGASKFCGGSCYLTQIEGVVICQRNPDLGYQVPDAEYKKSLDPRGVDHHANTAYLHISATMGIYDRFELIQGELCKTDRKANFNKLQAIADGNPYALGDVYKHGHSVHVAGAVAYVLKCEPMNATVIGHPNCTEEVPVKVNGEIKFADPLSWILQDIATIIPCSDLMPVRFKVNTQWWCQNEGREEVNLKPCDSPPIKLNSTTSIYAEPSFFTLGLGDGIVTEAQRKAFRLKNLIMGSRKSVIVHITDSSMKNRGGVMLMPGQPGIPLSGYEIKNIGYTLGGFFFPLFPIFGEGWFYFVSALLCYTIVRKLCTLAARFYLIWIEKGPGWWLLAAPFQVLTEVARTPISIIKAIYKENEDKRANLGQVVKNLKERPTFQMSKATRGSGLSLPKKTKKKSRDVVDPTTQEPGEQEIYAPFMEEALGVHDGVVNHPPYVRDDRHRHASS